MHQLQFSLPRDSKLIDTGRSGGGKPAFSTYIRAELEVGSTTADVGVVRVVEMSVENLLGQCEGSVEPREHCSTASRSGQKSQATNGHRSFVSVCPKLTFA